MKKSSPTPEQLERLRARRDRIQLQLQQLTEKSAAAKTRAKKAKAAAKAAKVAAKKARKNWKNLKEKLAATEKLLTQINATLTEYASRLAAQSTPPVQTPSPAAPKRKPIKSAAITPKEPTATIVASSPQPAAPQITSAARPHAG